MELNYYQICSNFLKDLPKKQGEILSRRFGLNPSSASWRSGDRRETLESIGKDYGITRERVRQIEKDSFLRLEPKIRKNQKVFQYFKIYFKKRGDLKKEEVLLNELAGQKLKNQIYFLLTLGKDFERFAEASDFYSFWTINQNSISRAKKIISFAYGKLKGIGRPLRLRNLADFNSLNQNVLLSYLEISKKIQKNSKDLYGLKDWPEINPRGIKDKAFLVFKEEERPLHFNEVASLMGKALPQTVHNELIKDPRFILVGRGLYALSEWGYEKGIVRDIISKILRESVKPITKKEILEKTLKQRLVKENTILLNLSNKKYFLRTPEGKYRIKRA